MCYKSFMTYNTCFDVFECGAMTPPFSKIRQILTMCLHIHNSRYKHVQCGRIYFDIQFCSIVHVQQKNILIRINIQSNKTDKLSHPSDFKH